MPDDRVAGIRARLAAATPGPWRLWRGSAVTATDSEGIVFRVANATPVNARFIANAPADIAWLLDRLDEAEADADRLASFAERPHPIGAYMRWSQDGDADDAATLQEYDDARTEALAAHDARREAT